MAPRRPKDKNAPRRPAGSYFLFLKDVRKQVVMDMETDGGKPSLVDIAKEIGKRYRELPESKVAEYKKQAQKALKKYHDQTVAYHGTKNWQEHQDTMKEYRKRVRIFKRKAAGLPIRKKKRKTKKVTKKSVKKSTKKSAKKKVKKTTKRKVKKTTKKKTKASKK